VINVIKEINRLTAVVENTSCLLIDVNDDKDVKCLNVIICGRRQLAAVVQQLLRWSRS